MGTRTYGKRRLVALVAVSGVVVLLVFAVAQIFGSGTDTGHDESTPPTTNPYRDLVPDLPPAPEAEPVELTVEDGDILPVLHSVPTDQPVAFITIDDGGVRSREGLQVIEAADVPVAVFPLVTDVRDDPDYFFDLVELGATVHAHSVTHPMLTDLPRPEHHEEVCGSGDQLSHIFGRRPHLFRPPYGEYDQVTQEAALACGFEAIVHWRVTVDYGDVEYVPAADGVEPGDILLLHFRDDLADDLLAALRAVDEAGLTVGRLDDYL